MEEISRIFLEKYYNNSKFTYIESSMVLTDDPLQEIEDEPGLIGYRFTTVNSYIDSNDMLVKQEVKSTPIIILGDRVDGNKMISKGIEVNYGNYSLTYNELLETQEQLKLRLN